MKEIIKKEKCVGCHACYNICPKSAIKMEEDTKGFMHPVINQDTCIDCKLCQSVCPVLQNKERINNIEAHAIYNLNDEERKNSSSGGIFILLAKEILKNNGVIFGAAFNKDFGVRHIKAENEEDVKKLMTSKYTQSKIGTTYIEAKKCLNQGQVVLFTGTPCQIEGLQTYLKKEYENLITQDIICHGVPSPKVWRKYREFRKEEDKKNPVNINFRNKDDGWNKYNIKIEYRSGEYKKVARQDEFMKGFLADLYLRDSCHNCSFKKKNRNSDITLADFWGIEHMCKEMDDNKGTSLVITHTKKGKDIFDKIKENCRYKQVDVDESTKYNKQYTNSVKENKYREVFFRKLDDVRFDKLISKYVKKKSLIKKVLSKIKRSISIKN